mgnify:FL=1
MTDNFKKNLEKLSLTRSELFQQLDILHNLIIEKNLSKYDEILGEINISSVNTTMIIGLLRTSFLYKNILFNWKLFLEKAKTELKYRNLNPNKLLIGMI